MKPIHPLVRTMLALLAVLALSGVGAAFATQSAHQSTPSASEKTYGCPPNGGHHGDDDDDGGHHGDDDDDGGHHGDDDDDGKSSGSSYKTSTTKTGGGDHGDDDDDGGNHGDDDDDGGHDDDCPPPPCPDGDDDDDDGHGGHGSKTSKTGGNGHSGGNDCDDVKPGCGPDKTDGVAGNSGQHQGQPPKDQNRGDCPNPPGHNKPAATTGSASYVTKSSAKPSGSVNPNGANTSAYFEYGKTSAFGKKTSSQALGNGKAAKTISAPISGLTKSTKYYFRVVATSSRGTTKGATKYFTTKSY